MSTLGSVSVLYTKLGTVIGTATSDMNGRSHTVVNPCIVHVGESQVVLQPLIGNIVTEDSITILDEEIVFRTTEKGALFTPTVELHNYYNQLFGSGISIVTANGK